MLEGATSSWFGKVSLVLHRPAGSRQTALVSQIPGWDTSNIARSDPLGKRIYGWRFSGVLGQDVVRMVWALEATWNRT